MKTHLVKEYWIVSLSDIFLFRELPGRCQLKLLSMLKDKNLFGFGQRCLIGVVEMDYIELDDLRATVQRVMPGKFYYEVLDRTKAPIRAIDNTLKDPVFTTRRKPIESHSDTEAFSFLSKPQ